MKLFLTVTLLFLVGAVLAQDDAAQPPQPVEDGEDVDTDDDGVAVDPEELIWRCNAIQKRLCRNGSTCVKDGLFRFTCDCVEGTSGRFCGTVDPCFGDDEKCANGGECERITNNMYRCHCDPKWSGKRCESVSRYSCKRNNPCTEENIFFYEDAVTVYYAHRDEAKFIQCDPFVHEANCHEFDCPAGLVFDNVLNVCNWP